MISTPPAKPIVFYDGSCPLCRSEIDHYRRIDNKHKIEWLDLTQNRDRIEAYGILYDTAMKRLHSINTNGEKVTGVGSFLLIWEQLDYYHYLARITRILRLEKPLDCMYQKFAKWRFKRRCGAHCENSCRIPPL